jgi:hypothetical protein
VRLPLAGAAVPEGTANNSLRLSAFRFRCFLSLRRRKCRPHHLHCASRFSEWWAASSE